MNINTLKSPFSFLGLSGIKQWLLLFGLVAMGAIGIKLVTGQTIPPVIPAIAFTSAPLFPTGAADKPAITLALSVEFPTVGAQYLDGTYTNTNEYLGYYDAEACYTYNNAPTETPGTGQTVADYKRFDRSGAATSRKCANAFSGNFLNWASSSAIDMLRLALSGGDRYIDTASLTILQRAVIPNGNPSCFWNTSNFPAKQLPKDGGGAGTYWGAVPIAMITQAAGSDIWVANTLNQIFFGTSQTGGCGNTGAYTLGGPPSSSNIGPITNSSSALPSGSTNCASENSNCNFSGVKEVWYGANNSWKVAPASNGVLCANSVFGDPISGTAKNCYTRTYSGSWTPPTSSSALNSDGFFFSRVQVCNVSGTTLLDSRDYGLCKQYPNGTYKPTGSIQKYSDQLRLAAFGYLMDQASGGNFSARYGGVLRAPMKYVGAKTFDENGLDNTPVGGNTKAEWDINTGVFSANPEGDTTQTPPVSGVINYLNKFGRTGPVAGRYKIYDPVGELYGEALRYLQGLPPTPAAISSITSDMYDGFPVATTWTDPYGGTRTSTADYSCLKSNIVVIGDVDTWDSTRLLTRTPDLSNNLPDLNFWTQTALAFESNTIRSYTDGQGTTRTTSNFNTPNISGQVGANGNQGPLVGAAYWAHMNDIRGTSWTGSPLRQRPGLRIKSFFFDVNEYGNSNSTSYRQNQNQFFTASKYGGFESNASNTGNQPYNAYGNPFKRQDGTNDNNVWQDSARPGEASTYYLQSSARGVLAAFDSIFGRAATSARSISGAAAASKNLTTAGTYTYQSGFDTSDWSGDVFATSVSLSGTSTLVSGASAGWTASARLAAMSTPATSRTIVVGRVGATSNPTATDFSWAAIDASLQDNLRKATPTSSTDTVTIGQGRLNYLRGDRSQEGTSFRTRNKLLGDIVNSAVVYSGAPSTSVGPSTSYPGFYTATLSRTPAVFVGANDGMMHAFNANTGDELFGYIPSWMGTRLSALTSKSYATSNQIYVDATPVVAEAQVGSAGTSSDWKTVLVSGTGGGGSGVFALDVTDPTAFSSSKVMWEFTRTDDADLGYVFGRPKIMKMRTSAKGVLPATYRWFAMVASGINNYVPEAAFAGAFSSTGNPALFLLALDKPAGTAWANGTNYYKITLPIDNTLKTTNATGLVNFTTTQGTAGEVTRVYMGDLHGKVWKLDFAARGTAEWTMERLSFYKGGTTAPFPSVPLYSAQTAAGVIQPIVAAPVVAPAPFLQGVPTNYVAFVTGKYLEPNDKTSTSQNSVYRLFDNESTAIDSTSAIAGRGRLQAATVNTTTLVISVTPFTDGRPASDSTTSTRAGWYADFPVLGERSVGEMQLFGTTLFYGTLIPASIGSMGSCTASGGSGNLYQSNIITGQGSYAPSTVGLFGGILIFNIPSAATTTDTNSVGKRIYTMPRVGIQYGSAGFGGGGGNIPSAMSVPGVLSWRQINNYLDLKAIP